MEPEYITHNFQPIYDKESRILMLGTMPSPKSREVGFYYGHPRNRFWKVISDVCGEELPLTKEEKTALEEMQKSDNFKGDTTTKQTIFQKFRSYFS